MMVNIWLPTLDGVVRLYHQGEWHTYPSFEALNAALSSFGLIKAAGKSSTGANTPANIYFPTLHFTQVRESLSRSNYQKLGTQGVTYLLESHVLSSVDHLSVKSSMVNDHECLIFALDNATINQLKHSLSLAGLELRALLPDFLLLPKPTGTRDAFVYGDDISTIMRTGDKTGVHIDDAAFTFTKLDNPPSTLQVAGAGFDVLQTQLIDVDVIVTDASTEHVAPMQNPERHTLNMMPKAASAGLPAYFKVVAAVFLLALLSVVVYDTLRLVRYGKIEKAYQSQLYKQYSHWYASERPPADVRRAIQSKIGGTAEQEVDVFGLMARAAPILKQSGLDATKVYFFEDRLELNVKASSIDELERLVNNYTAQGLQASLGAVTPVAADVSGIINIDSAK